MIELNLDHMKLQLELPPGVSADPKLLDGGHPLHYVLKMRKQTETYLNRVHELLADLGPSDVLEFCAGIGLVYASNPQLRGGRTDWTGIELDPNCEALAKQIAPGMDWRLGDMYDPRWTEAQYADLVICEFPTNTLPKLWREPKRADMMNRITQQIKPKHLYIADVGYFWIHLANHWPLYEKRFGVKPTRDNYHLLFDLYAKQTWGYCVTKMTVGGGAQYLLLEPV